MLDDDDDGRATDAKWHFDKRIPIALIVSLLLGLMGQTLFFVSWKATIESRVEHLEADSLARAPQAERIIRVETKLDGIKETVTEIKNLLRVPQERR